MAALVQQQPILTSAAQKKRHQGTYRIVPKVEWTSLLLRDFGHPDWVALYPMNAKGDPTNLFTPRMACKFFHDAVFIIKKGEENQKYMQDRIPELAHRQYRKKQWRKQFFEAARRVCCRIARGVGFHPNCLAEDAFVFVILNQAFELGWRRIQEHIDPLPDYEAKDRDFARVMRVATNEEIGNLLKGGDASKDTKKSTTSASGAKVAKADVRDIKAWFNCYEAGRDTIFDHIVHIEDDEIEGSVYSTSTTSSMLDGRSRSSTLASETDEGFFSGPSSPARGVRSRGNSNAPLPTVVPLVGMGTSPDKASILAEGMGKVNLA